MRPPTAVTAATDMPTISCANRDLVRAGLRTGRDGLPLVVYHLFRFVLKRLRESETEVGHGALAGRQQTQNIVNKSRGSCVTDHFVVAVKNRSVSFSKLSPPNRNLDESRPVARSSAQRTPEGVIDAIDDRMQRRDAEFGCTSTMYARPCLRQGLAALLRSAMRPGRLDR